MRGGGGLLGPEFGLARDARRSGGLVATGYEAFVINDLLIYLPFQVQHYLKLDLFAFSGAALFEALPRDSLSWHFSAGHHFGQEGCGSR